ncbi:hypothetical protein [Rhizobium sp. MHM7A]|uniref:hypothetical protein n=1 Tax=Rhizobium sp. MHM7A TaxID=2583233 RepID=UPI00110603B0|nr:hypothetical protein [Rhizobium sp. MHM7A]TLX15921.1 hypothetical protein FFR93_00985 [Rhizobium sp. MHM7A]
MEIEALKQDLRRSLAERQEVLTRDEIAKLVESVAIIEASGVDSGDDVTRILKRYPQLANHVIDEIERVTVIEATRYAYEDWIKQELRATAEEFYVAQFGDDFSPADNAVALLRDAAQAMEQYWMTDAKGIGSIALRSQMDDLAEANRIAGMTHEPNYAHPMLEKLKSVCQQSEAFKDQLSRRWELAKDVVDNRELFEIDRVLAYKV